MIPRTTQHRTYNFSFCCSSLLIVGIVLLVFLAVVVLILLVVIVLLVRRQRQQGSGETFSKSEICKLTDVIARLFENKKVETVE